MSAIRDAVFKQHGTDKPVGPEFDPASLTRFSPNLPAQLAPAERDDLARRAAELEPWLQGPFLLGGDLVVGGVWRIDLRWQVLGPELPESLTGQRVLDVGSNAGYDPFSFKLRGADEVLACEPYAFIDQARFLESIYETGVDFQQLGWADLDPQRQGQFDLVHCHGVLYHEKNPVAMVQRLFEMMAPGGRLYLGSMMLVDPELDEFARFVPGDYYGDGTWWWVPGSAALRGMVESVGLEVVKSFGESPGPPGEFETKNGYVLAKRPA